MAETNDDTQNTVAVGSPVPDFNLPYATRDSIAETKLGAKDLVGKTYLLAFYPADWSGGCTKEMCTFRDGFAQFDSLDMEIYPVSTDLVYSHHEWAKALNLPFALLADQTHAFSKAMGVYKEESGMARRAVFVIDANGKIAYKKDPYSVKDDVDLKDLQAFLSRK